MRENWMWFALGGVIFWFALRKENRRPSASASLPQYSPKTLAPPSSPSPPPLDEGVVEVGTDRPEAPTSLSSRKEVKKLERDLSEIYNEGERRKADIQDAEIQEDIWASRSGYGFKD